MLIKLCWGLAIGLLYFVLDFKANGQIHSIPVCLGIEFYTIGIVFGSGKILDLFCGKHVPAESGNLEKILYIYNSFGVFIGLIILSICFGLTFTIGCIYGWVIVCIGIYKYFYKHERQENHQDNSMIITCLVFIVIVTCSVTMYFWPQLRQATFGSQTDHKINNIGNTAHHQVARKNLPDKKLGRTGEKPAAAKENENNSYTPNRNKSEKTAPSAQNIIKTIPSSSTHTMPASPQKSAFEKKTTIPQTASSTETDVSSRQTSSPELSESFAGITGTKNMPAMQISPNPAKLATPATTTQSAASITSSQTPTSKSLSPQQLVYASGVWRGTYTIENRKTGLTLIIKEKNGEPHCLFTFYPVRENSDIKSGQYEMKMDYKNDTNEYTLTGTRWVKRNDASPMLNLSGNINNKNFSGYIKDTDGRTLGKFSLRKK